MFFTISKAFAFLLDPLFYLYLSFIVLILFSYKKKNTFKLIIGISMYCLLITSPLVGFICSKYENSTTKPEILDSDTVMILGGGSLYFDKTKGIYILGGTFERFLESLRLMKNNQLKRLIISGGDPRPLPQNIEGESYSFQRLSMELGVPKENIYVEAKSLNTYQEAIFIKDYLTQNNIKKIIVVTSAIHMPRSIAIFKKQGIEVIPYPVNYLEHSLRDSFEWGLYRVDELRSLIHELVGFLVYRLKGYL